MAEACPETEGSWRCRHGQRLAGRLEDGYVSTDRRGAGEPDRFVGPIWRRQCHDNQGGPTRRSRHQPERLAARGSGASGAGSARPRAGWTADEAANLKQQRLVRIEVASGPPLTWETTVIAADFGERTDTAWCWAPPLAEPAGGAPVQLACYVDGQLMGEGSANSPQEEKKIWQLP